VVDLLLKIYSLGEYGAMNVFEVEYDEIEAFGE
jgi:hypothetical protein